MAVINEISGKEGIATNFLIACLDGVDSEVDNSDMVKPYMEYMKEFIDSFDVNEIAPILQRVQRIRAATPNPSIPTAKAQNTAAFQAGTRKPEDIKLPVWPSDFKNPIMIKKMFGTVPTGKKLRKSISKSVASKISGKISAACTDAQILYLVEYMMKFFMIHKNEENYYVLYGNLLDKCKDLGYLPKPRALCFTVKTQDAIAKDIIGMFLYEDMLNKDNQEYMMNCLNRYYDLYGA